MKNLLRNRIFWFSIILLLAVSIVAYQFHFPQPHFIFVYLGSIAFVLLILAWPSIVKRLEDKGLEKSFLLVELYRDTLFLPFVPLILAHLFPFQNILYSIGAFCAFVVGLFQLYGYRRSIIGKRELILSLFFMFIALFLNLWLIK